MNLKFLKNASNYFVVGDAPHLLLLSTQGERVSRMQGCLSRSSKATQVCRKNRGGTEKIKRRICSIADILTYQNYSKYNIVHKKCNNLIYYTRMGKQHQLTTTLGLNQVKVQRSYTGKCEFGFILTPKAATKFSPSYIVFPLIVVSFMTLL